MSFGAYLSQYWVAVLNDTILHVDVTLIALAVAVVVGVGLGVLTYRSPLWGGLATTLTGSFLTIPSLALLGILIGPLGLGWGPVLVALVVYALLPITRNTIVGLQGVSPAVVEAGRGMGVGPARMLWTVRLPLAWPVIFSGIRVSTQIIIGIAAIGAFVRGPGLGNQIVDGYNRWGSSIAVPMMLAGTLGIVLLAVLFDAVFVLVGRLTTPRGLHV